MRNFGIYLLSALILCSEMYAEVATLNLGRALLLHPGWDRVSIETARPVKHSQNQMDSEKQEDLFRAALQYEAVLSEKQKAEEEFSRKLVLERNRFTDAYAWQEYARRQREEFQSIWDERLEDSIALGEKWLGSASQGRKLILEMLFEICEESHRISSEEGLSLLWHQVSDEKAAAPVRESLAADSRAEPLRSGLWLAYERLEDYPALRKETLGSWLKEFRTQIRPVADKSPLILGEVRDLTSLVVQNIFARYGITGAAASAIVQDLIHPLPILEPEEAQ